MRFPGRIYLGKQGTYLAIYSHHPDICIAAPTSLAGQTQRLAHVQYSEGGKRRGINIFSLKVSKKISIPEINFAEEVSTTSNITPSTDQLQDVQYQVVRNTPSEVLDLIRADISRYCKRPATTSFKTKIQFQDKIIPVTSLRTINPKRLLTPGKQDFVPSCSLEANIDFARGCISGWLPESKAEFNGEIFRNFFLSPRGECMYCYAQPKHKSFPKTVYKIDYQRLKQELLGNCRLTVGCDKTLDKKVVVLRFGKRTETGSKYTIEQLALTLETCTETKTRTVLPTKFLGFDPEVAKLLKKTNSVVLYSIGFDELEPGAVKHGCDNDWRTEQAIKYKKAGVNSIIYLLTIIHTPPRRREKRILKKAKQHDIPIQLIPMRFSSKALCKKVTRIAWDDLKRSGRSLFGDENDVYWGSYEQQYSGIITPLKIHQDWLNIIQNNSRSVRMCHHNSELTWCGTCYLKDTGFKTITQEVELERFGSTKSQKKSDKSQLNFI